MMCENSAPSFRCVAVGTLPSTSMEKVGQHSPWTKDVVNAE